MKKVFPELDFIEIPFDHDIYHQSYNFNKGLSKFMNTTMAILKIWTIFKGRLVCLRLRVRFRRWLGGIRSYNDSSQPGKTLQMGANILEFALMGLSISPHKV